MSCLAPHLCLTVKINSRVTEKAHEEINVKYDDNVYVVVYDS